MATDMDARGGEMRVRSLDSPRNIDGESNAAPAGKQSPASGHVNLYIRNVAPNATDKELQDAFRRFGDVISCSVVRDPYTRECRGFAFVKVASEDVADAAMNADDGLTVCGRRLGVERARRNGPHEKTPGQYLGIDRSVRDRYSGHKRGHDAAGGPRDPYADDRRPRGAGGLGGRDRWEGRGGHGFDDLDRYNPRRRLSPERRPHGSPARPPHGGNGGYRGYARDDVGGQDRGRIPNYERGYDRDHGYDRDRGGVGGGSGRDRPLPPRDPTRRSGAAKDDDAPGVSRRDDYGRDRH